MNEYQVIEPRFEIGQRFIRRGTERQDIETITDIIRHVNTAGEVIKLRYQTTHLFCGQMVKNSDVSDTTIAMGLAQNGIVG